MADSKIYNLTCGSVDATFEQTLLSVQDYGFTQTVFEVERLTAAKNASAGRMAAGEISVLRPSGMQACYPLVKPGDRVSCSGLGKDAAGQDGLYRIRRMAEGFNRKAMTER